MVEISSASIYPHALNVTLAAYLCHCIMIQITYNTQEEKFGVLLVQQAFPPPVTDPLLNFPFRQSCPELRARQRLAPLQCL
jgi:hypothetical protein